MNNPIVWVEIPVKEMHRAIAFYNSVFGWQLKELDMGPLVMALFPNQIQSTGASGALVYHKTAYKVSEKDAGPVVYFSTDKITPHLQLIEKSGGKIIQAKTVISADYGSMALFRDSEGNRIALFSNEKD